MCLYMRKGKEKKRRRRMVFWERYENSSLDQKLFFFSFSFLHRRLNPPPNVFYLPFNFFNPLPPPFFSRPPNNLFFLPIFFLNSVPTHIIFTLITLHTHAHKHLNLGTYPLFGVVIKAKRKQKKKREILIFLIAFIIIIIIIIIIFWFLFLQPLSFSLYRLTWFSFYITIFFSWNVARNVVLPSWV